jgi:hypothetical protein
MNLIPASQVVGDANVLNKFAVEAGDKGRPDLFGALRDLLDEGVVVHIDRFYGLRFGRMLDVYQLTSRGIALVQRENIVATNP